MKSSARRQAAPEGGTPNEQIILNLIASGEQDGEALLAKSELSVTHYNQALSMLEITGKITSLGGNIWTL